MRGDQYVTRYFNFTCWTSDRSSDWFFAARHFMQKYLKQNPPINEEMIKTLMMQMGRKPNQKQINQMMKSMSKYQ